MNEARSLSRTELFNRARGGDVDALGQLLHSFRNNLRKLASVRSDKGLRRKIDTSDILQEIEMQAFDDFQSFKGETIGELVNWLREILRTKLARTRRDYLTQKRNIDRERDLNANIEKNNDAFADLSRKSGTQPFDRILQLEEAACLFNALSELPAIQNEVVNLYFFEGLTMRQVGERLDKSENAIQKLWTRALAGLGKNLLQLNANNG